jgi:hypothetical protein
MTRIVVFLLPMLALSQVANATTYYVAQSGSNANNGTGTGTPFKTIKHALGVAGAGDTICINDNSTYNVATGEGGNGAHSAVVDINTGGSAGSPLTLMACNGHSPVIEHGVTNQNFYGVRVNAQWVTVGPGITVYGGADKITAAQCLAQSSQRSPCIGSGFTATNSHITFTGDVAYYNASAGFAATPTTFGVGRTTDYIDFIGNVSYKNAFYSVSGSSGFNLYQLTNIDHNPGYHNHIVGNYAWGDRMFLNEAALHNQARSSQMDGNGFIVDDSNHTQHRNQGPAYDGSTLVENNVFAYNGSSGAHAFQSNNVDFFSNTFWHNVQSWPNKVAHNIAVTGSGDAGNCAGTNVRFYNNLIVSDPAAGAHFSTIWGAHCSLHSSTGGHNWQLNATVDPAFRFPGDVYSGDPQIANPVKGAGANWMLHAGSPLPRAGDTSVVPALPTDFYGNPRPTPPSLGMGRVVQAFMRMHGLILISAPRR